MMEGRGFNRMTPGEARRATAALEECLEKLSFLGSMTPDVLQHRDELSRFVGDEISRILLEQRDLESRYENLIAQRSALKGLANKRKYKEIQAEIEDVSRALRDSTKNLCRSLKDNPNISENLFKIQRDRNQLVLLLQQTVDELRGVSTFEGLSKKVAEEQLGQERLAQVQQEERAASQAVRQLEKELTNEQVDYESQVHEKRLAISAQKEDLQLLRAQVLVDTKYFRREATARATAVTRDYRFNTRELTSQITDIEGKEAMEAVVHKETMEFLRRKQEQLDKQKVEWESRYDTEVEELQEKLEEVSKERNSLVEKLTHLRQRREEELALEAKEKAERERLELEEKLRQEREDLENASAIVIQRAMGRWIQRVQQAKADKQKKKKGGKGGKKKGKK